MSQVTSDTDALVAIGRIEAKLDATLPEHAKRLDANTAFQQTTQASFTEHAKILAGINTRLDTAESQIGEIRDDMRGRFTKNTVLIGLALTAVNVAMNLVGKI